MTTEKKLFSFAVLTDLHISEVNGLDKFHHALDVICESDISFIQVLGDVMIDAPLSEFKRILDRTGLPYRVTFGNNDVPRLKEFQDAFGGYYYSFEHEHCLFLSLFNVVPAMDSIHARHGDFNEDQEKWVRSILEEAMRRETDYRKIFIFAHVPPLQPGSPYDPGFRMTVEATDFLYGICNDFGVDACFYGHLHHNEVYEFEDTWHITTPSVNWNFINSFGYRNSDWIPADYGGFRVVHVYPDEINDELRWLHRSLTPIQA